MTSKQQNGVELGAWGVNAAQVVKRPHSCRKCGKSRVEHFVHPSDGICPGLHFGRWTE